MSRRTNCSYADATARSNVAAIAKVPEKISHANDPVSSETLQNRLERLEDMIRHLTGTDVVESVGRNTKAADIMANEQDNESLADLVTPATSISTNGARTSSAAGEALWATLLSK